MFHNIVVARRISVVIPNYNGSATIGICLEALFSSTYDDFEVIVVDDFSSDNSVDIIKTFPCLLIRLSARSGASKARNAGAEASSGEVLFFIDADCVVRQDTLSTVGTTMAGRKDEVFGGTYTPLSYDDDFFSNFQSVFINYSETKNDNPDYVASHAMIVDRELFVKNGGFPEDFMPILEDVEFSHRLRRSGVRLRMNPGLLVVHIFRFTFRRSLRNAFRKSKYWTFYSLGNSDLFADSGTASLELKVNVLSYLVMLFFFPAGLFLGSAYLLPIPFVLAANIFACRGLLRAYFRAKGPLFGIGAMFYYILAYPLPVGLGAFAGGLKYVLERPERRGALGMEESGQQ